MGNIVLLGMLAVLGAVCWQLRDTTIHIGFLDSWHGAPAIVVLASIVLVIGMVIIPTVKHRNTVFGALFAIAIGVTVTVGCALIIQAQHFGK